MNDWTFEDFELVPASLWFKRTASLFGQAPRTGSGYGFIRNLPLACDEHGKLH